MYSNLRFTYAIETISVHASAARLASFANTSHPLDPDTITDLDGCILGSRAHLDDFADALVAAYLACLGGEGQYLPGVEHDAHVGVAHTRVGSVCVVSRTVQGRIVSN